MNEENTMVTVVSAQPTFAANLQAHQLQAQQPQMMQQQMIAGQAHLLQAHTQTQFQSMPVTIHPSQPQPPPHSDELSREEDEKHQCRECDKILPGKKEFLQHMYIHKENPKYICPICSKIFPSEPGFKRHVRAHQNRARRNLSCSICQAVFSARADLEEHHRDNHLHHKLFRCHLCGAQFSWQDNLNKHMRMHNVDAAGAAGKSRDSSSSDAPATPTPAEEPHNYKCDTCHLSFMDNTSLRIHSRSHSAQAKEAKKVYTCKVCSKEFKFDFSYIAHMNAHEKLKPGSKEGKAQGQEDIADPERKGITEIQLPQQASPEDDSKDEEEDLDITQRPPYGITYTPPLDGIPANKTRTIRQADGKHQTEFTVIEERRFVKSPFKGGRRSMGEKEGDGDAGSQLPKQRRRPVNPVLYDLPMTDERPYKCSFCDMAFRWEVSLSIHEREHDPTYRAPEKTARGRPRALEPGKDFTYRIVRRRHSDDDDEEEDEFEDIKGGLEPRPKRRYRKKKDLEKAQAAFAPVAAAKAAADDDNQATTVVKLTRVVQQQQQDGTTSATSVTGFLPQQQQQVLTSQACQNSGVLAMQLGSSSGTVASPSQPAAAAAEAGAAAESVYAVNHQGVHFQVLADQQSAAASAADSMATE